MFDRLTRRSFIGRAVAGLFGLALSMPVASASAQKPIGGNKGVRLFYHMGDDFGGEAKGPVDMEGLHVGDLAYMVDLSPDGRVENAEFFKVLTPVEPCSPPGNARCELLPLPNTAAWHRVTP